MSPKKIPMMKNKLGVKNKSERTKHDDAFIFLSRRGQIAEEKTEIQDR